MEMVRPWKFSCAAIIFVWPAGTPFMSEAHFRAIFSAVSTASAPEFISNTLS